MDRHTLVDVVVGYMEAHSPTGPVGFRYREEDAIGELVVYPTPVELVGGADDGAVVVQGSPWICRRWRPSLIG